MKPVIVPALVLLIAYLMLLKAAAILPPRIENTTADETFVTSNSSENFDDNFENVTTEPLQTENRTDKSYLNIIPCTKGYVKTSTGCQFVEDFPDDDDDE